MTRSKDGQPLGSGLRCVPEHSFQDTSLHKSLKNSLERLPANPSCREIQRGLAATDILDKELLFVDTCYIVGTVDLYVHWLLSVNVTRIKGTTTVTKTFT